MHAMLKARAGELTPTAREPRLGQRRGALPALRTLAHIKRSARSIGILPGRGDAASQWAGVRHLVARSPDEVEAGHLARRLSPGPQGREVMPVGGDASPSATCRALHPRQVL